MVLGFKSIRNLLKLLISDFYFSLNYDLVEKESRNAYVKNQENRMVKGFRAATKNDISPMKIISHSMVLIKQNLPKL